MKSIIIMVGNKSVTGSIRHYLIDMARTDKAGIVFGTHHSSTGFGEITRDQLSRTTKTSR